MRVLGEDAERRAIAFRPFLIIASQANTKYRGGEAISLAARGDGFAPKTADVSALAKT